MEKVALITGATSGIGEATACMFASNGYSLIITGRRADRLKKLKQKLEKDSTRILDLCFDVRNEDEVRKALEELPDSWKKIDVLVNNAGLAAGLDPIDKIGRAHV